MSSNLISQGPHADESEVVEMDSPLGPVYATITSFGLSRISFEESPGEFIESDDPEIWSIADSVKTQLKQYFEGSLEVFDVPIDLRAVKGFSRKVLDATALIPYGKTQTYREVAEGSGNPKAVRAAGNALGSNPIPIIVPCHRVLRSGGELGGYTGGVHRKKFLLDLETRS